MGKASSSKKVARIASTGGGRTARGRRPMGWYTVLGVLVAVGIFLVAFSRHEQQAAANVHPRGNDHWHDAYSIDICGQIQPNLPQNTNLSSSPAPGIHTHGDGLIHLEPYVSGVAADAGAHATLARFAADYPGFKLTSSQLQYPGQKVYKNGDKCGTKPGEVQIRFWPKASASPSTTFTNPNLVRLNDQGAITIAFVPVGTDIPKPSTITALTNPNALESGRSGAAPVPPVSVPPGSTPPGSAPAASTPPGSTPASTPASTPPASTPAAGAPASGSGGSPSP